MPYKFRTPGPWGPGSPGDLDPVDIDGNFWQAIQDITAKAATGVGISNIVQSGNQLTFVLTDHTLLGPYVLPVTMPKFKGEWLPAFDYLAGDIISHGGSTYGVNYNHTSDATFDPGKNDGVGNDAYTLLLSNPALTIPTGGAVGQFLRKTAVGDYLTQWQNALLNDLSDVVITTPIEGQSLVYTSGIWINTSVSATLAGLSDVLQSPAPNTGDAVIWNGAAFTYGPSGASTLAGLSDIFMLTTPPEHGTVLQYYAPDGLWENFPLQFWFGFGSATKTLSLDEANTFINFSANSAITLTIPTNASVAFPNSTHCWARQDSNSAGQISIVGAGGVTIIVPSGRQAKTRAPGSVVEIRSKDVAGDFWVLHGDLAYVATVVPGGGMTFDPRTIDSEVYTWTPTGSPTVTASSFPIGCKLKLIITTTGTTSFTITFGTGFKSQGTLATGTVSGKVFVVSFIGDGVNLNEVSRTTAM